MTGKLLAGLGAGCLVLFAQAASAQQQWTRLPGYLSQQEMPNAAAIIGPPPANGSGTKAGDVATYEATRKLKDTPRWTLAVSDAQFGPAAIMREYSCAAGMSLDPAIDPALFQLLRRVVEDSESVEQPAKAAYKRPRPFVENGGPMCTPDDKSILNSYSYPSGHSTFSWTVGMIMAQLLPDRATALMNRARSYGESRVICGAHYESDVQAGRMVASALVSVLQTNSQFRSDLDSARSELMAKRSQSSVPDAGECRLEADADANPVW
ncbi:MAG TPA: phosphatase PAP2 family protein [Rhizomicrobium sp.]|jgi:acid phosphatase (class A)|nr:phosphatase PAP2 family protein [Rhizomicrobium sp.]